MTSFKGAQYPKDVILFAVFSYVRYGVSYRDLEEIMHERGVAADHTTLKVNSHQDTVRFANSPSWAHNEAGRMYFPELR